MPTEAELRARFHDDAPGTAGSARDAASAIDLDAVIRRSSTRRRPRVLAVGVLSSLAVLAVVVPIGVSAALGQTGLFSASSGSIASSSDAGASGQKATESAPGISGPSVSGRAPAEKVNLCTGPLAELAPATNGLLLTVDAVTAAATDRSIPATVTLTNTGSVAFRGDATPSPSLTLSRDGIVLWHSNGAVASLAQAIDLAPGASTTFSTTFEPLVCGVADDERSSFRENLPAAGPGSYALSAVMDVTSDSGVPILVSGPTSVVTLR